MSKPHISVHVQVGEYPSDRDVDVRLNLDESLVRNTYRSLDFPSPDAGIAAMLCDSAVTIERVTKSREEAAKWIAKPLLNLILDSMGLHDTQMGYPKFQRRS